MAESGEDFYILDVRTTEWLGITDDCSVMITCGIIIRDHAEGKANLAKICHKALSLYHYSMLKTYAIPMSEYLDSLLDELTKDEIATDLRI